MRTKEAFSCPTGREELRTNGRSDLEVAARLFRASGEPEIHFNGDVYRRSQLDDGPRYLIDHKPSTDRCVWNTGHGVTLGAERQEKSFAICSG